MKLLSVTIPCYNSQDYMEHCIETLLTGGEDVEILIVDDGSKDATAEIADRYQKKYPTIIKAIHQENGGHGAAVNTGIANATGLYFKVVDSDDWVKEDAYLTILEKLTQFCSASCCSKQAPYPAAYSERTKQYGKDGLTYGENTDGGADLR